MGLDSWYVSTEVLRTLSNIYDRAFYEFSSRLKSVNYLTVTVNSSLVTKNLIPSAYNR